MRNLLFCPLLRTALAGVGSKPAHHGVLMLTEMCIVHIFCPLSNSCAQALKGRVLNYNEISRALIPCLPARSNMRGRVSICKRFWTILFRSTSWSRIAAPK